MRRVTDLHLGFLPRDLGEYLQACAKYLIFISVFWHVRIGLQVLIEDYVHDAGTKFGVLALLNLATIGGGAFGLVSIARLALGGAA